LVLAEENKVGLARSMLEAHGLADKFVALQNFCRRLTRGNGSFVSTTGFSNATRLTAASAAPPDAERRGSKPSQIKPASARQEGSRPALQRPAMPARPGAADRHRYRVQRASSISAPLLTAMQKPPASDGGWLRAA